MFNIIVFSKDRAAQLDLFLRSLDVNWHDHSRVHVIYTASNGYYMSGYKMLMERFIGKNIHFELQGDFKTNTIEFINLSNPYTVFFVDDDVMVKPFNVKDSEFNRFCNDESILCLSLRLGKNISFCYTENRPSPVPKQFEGCKFLWKGEAGDWGYPMSLDGHIFRTYQILPLLINIAYTSPNTLEGTLAQNPLSIPYMATYELPKLFNVPVNKVQTDNANKFGNISQELLNQIYLNGKIIKLSPIEEVDTYMCHQEINYEYEFYA